MACSKIKGVLITIIAIPLYRACKCYVRAHGNTYNGHLHITLRGIDTIEERLQGMPLDRNMFALRPSINGLLTEMSRVTKVRDFQREVLGDENVAGSKVAMDALQKGEKKFVEVDTSIMNRKRELGKILPLHLG